mgnify:CR=1 FL=1
MHQFNFISETLTMPYKLLTFGFGLYDTEGDDQCIYNYPISLTKISLSLTLHKILKCSGLWFFRGQKAMKWISRYTHQVHFTLDIFRAKWAACIIHVKQYNIWYLLFEYIRSTLVQVLNFSVWCCFCPSISVKGVGDW